MPGSGRSAFWFIVVVGGAIVATTLSRLPLQIATHFGGNGAPNAWSSHGGYATLLTVIGLFVPVGIVKLVAGVGTVRPEWLNIPYRNYWIDPAHRAEGLRRIQGHLWWLGCLIAGLVLGIHFLLLQAHQSTPPRLHTRPFIALMAAFLLGIAFWIATFYRLLRPPITTGRDRPPA